MMGIVAMGWLMLPFANAAAGMHRREWVVEGVKREALVRVPANAAGPAPLVFVFHGHGSSMQQAAASLPFHARWPEAVVVYMQGLPTPGQLTDPNGSRTGWQRAPADQNDRDLKFFDVVLRSIEADYKIDERRIYAMGHSNGGSFTYLLWAKRGEVLAAFASSAAVAGPGDGPLVARPVVQIAGKNDPLVKFAWQQRMIETLRRNNACGDGEATANGCTYYPSKIGAPVMTYIHPGGHVYPPEATAIIVQFFKTQSKAAPTAP